ncbi:hypothetical protein PsYK624_049180 [Phanerochaete sordida]|uniref:Uncharacterized protein n=1 Tax=Phanerochaete sordida TaxID=48140 RepID=A0A9P3G5X9_9APHY|nr:hypothetical protein PsYK624_049180 [Phanerochaete sordida]
MAPKAGSSQSSPSALVADAISSLQKAVGTALASAEDHGKADLARANTEIATLRRDRDEAIKLLHVAKVESKDWERRGEGWKSSIEKSELTIQHQAETITQLREEALQWKNQLLRFEDASRREIQDWKDQYLRAEQERSRLSARLDQLIAEQLETRPLNGHHDPSHYTYSPSTAPPKAPKPAARQPRASTSTAAASERRAKPNSGYTTDRERTYVDGAPRPRTPKDAAPTRTPKARPGNTTPRASAPRAEPSPPLALAQPRLIRRVHAVVEVPVKEEEYSADERLDAPEASDGSGSEYVPERPARAAPGRARRRSSAARGKQAAGGRYVEIDESERDESEDDQLLIGSDDETGGGAAKATRTSTKHPRTSVGGAQTQSSTKKRKLNQDAVTGAQSRGSRRD